MKDAISFAIMFCGAFSVICFSFFVIAHGTEQHSTADRKRAIAECEQRGGIAVVVAGEISSRGIGCAQPLGQ